MQKKFIFISHNFFSSHFHSMLKNSILFTPQRIGPIVVPNRFIRSPISWCDADADGLPSQIELKHMVDLARGRVGLIIPGFMYPYKVGRVFIGQTGMSSPAHASAWQKTVDDIHYYGSKVIFQIAAGGIACDPNSIGGPELVSGPSANIFGRKNRELSKIEIDMIVESYINSAVHAASVGVDGVMIHYAHGYLLSQFASPASNQRKDEYGGSIENRARIIRRIADGIREAVGDKFAIIAKCNGHDCLENGITPEICAETINEVKKSKIDLFEISTGFLNAINMSRGEKRPINPRNHNEVLKQNYDMFWTQPEYEKYKEGYTVDYAKVVRNRNPDVKLAIVGGHRSFDKMEELVIRGRCEMVSLARPLIRDPFLVDKFYSGKLKVAECLSCNQCFLKPPGKPVSCQFPK
ncbi:oxidoreductase, FAD/FMN-binding family protein [Tritrichomonas foetus]|uniref:Oxidoreductase, FAD/FMN-binding family protein n=1 Tax=Tritrichomonas foetus TaxID=1144522 RepID=A0A1J4JQT7_9EUKA|nr:oxidoreductase, FAD/FMN-binding family protein [Tritrichomonas foetus]|eukprot:OHS99612.1 oxidoreductase, FAD/FMN-binding family protein [Tritrichomonas foetus]